MKELNYNNPNRENARTVAEIILNRLKIERTALKMRGVVKFFGLSLEFRDDMQYAEAGEFNFTKKTIFVNEKDTKVRQFFTVAHELGHYLLHKDYCLENGIKVISRNTLDSSSYDALEQEANEFAANFLVPTSTLLLKFKELDGDKEAIAKYFVVSHQVIDNRIKDLTYRGYI